MHTKLKSKRKKLKSVTKATLNKIGVDNYAHCSFGKPTEEKTFKITMSLEIRNIH